MSITSIHTQRNFPPSLWVTTSYLAEGIPNAIIMTVSLILYKNLGVDNAVITFWTSLLYLPWLLKPFWSPIIDLIGTKRRWMIITQWIMAIGFALVAWQVISPYYFLTTMILWYIIAFTSATHDIACDGFYLIALTPNEQSLFAGIRSTCFRIALIFGTGAIPYLAGKMMTLAKTFQQTGLYPDDWLGHLIQKFFYTTDSQGLAMESNSPFFCWLKENFLENPHFIAQSWLVALFIVALVFALLALWHTLFLPLPPNDCSSRKNQESQPDTLQTYQPKYHRKNRQQYSQEQKQKLQKTTSAQPDFVAIFISFFHQKNILSILAFLLLYRLAEAQIGKIATPFLLESYTNGGLGLATEQVGFVYGTLGVIGLLIGGILSGILVSMFGLKRMIWWMVIAINVPDLFYVYLAYCQPSSLYTISLLVVVEQIGYGFGFTGYMIFMMSCAKGQYKTVHYAIATGFMAMGMMLPGMFSGWIQEKIGYTCFFIWVCICTIPGFLSILLIPLDPDWGKETKKQPKLS